MSPGQFSLAGKVAAVTGANTGLGRAIAEALAGAGADVALVGRSDPAGTLTAIQALGRRAAWIEADLGNKPDHARIVSETVRQLGGLHVLVNNAGIIRRADSIDFTEADWEQPGSDRMVDAMVAWGNVETLRGRLGELQGAGADHVAIIPVDERGDTVALPVLEALAR